MGKPKEFHLISPVTIKKPTTWDLTRLLEAQRINPEMSITCFRETRKATLYNVFDRSNTDQTLKALEKLDPFAQFQGAVVVHQSKKT